MKQHIMFFLGLSPILIILSIFLYVNRYKYQYSFKREGLESAIKICILLIGPYLSFLIFMIYLNSSCSSVSSEEGPVLGLCDILTGVPIVFGFLFLPAIAVKTFLFGYKKIIPEGYISKTKQLSPFMVTLNLLCLSVLLSGLVIAYFNL